MVLRSKDQAPWEKLMGDVVLAIIAAVVIFILYKGVAMF